MKPVDKVISALVTQSHVSISQHLRKLSEYDVQKVENALSQLKRNATDAKKKRLANKVWKQWKSLCVEHGLDYEEQKKAKDEYEAQKVIKKQKAINDEKSIMNDLKKFSIPILILIILVTIITASAENLDEHGTAFTVLSFVGGFSVIFCVLSWFVIALSETVKEFSSSLFGARVLVVFHIWTLILVITGVNLSPIEIEGSEYFCQTVGGETTCYTDQDMENLINKYK